MNLWKFFKEHSAHKTPKFNTVEMEHFDMHAASHKMCLPKMFPKNSDEFSISFLFKSQEKETFNPYLIIMKTFLENDSYYLKLTFCLCNFYLMTLSFTSN